MASASIPHIDELPAVATLREQQEVEGVYACTRKERRISRAGTAPVRSRSSNARYGVPVRETSRSLRVHAKTPATS